MALVGWELDAGRKTIERNRGRDAENRARALRIERHQADISQRLAQAPGQEVATLAAHSNTPPTLLREIHSQQPRRIQGLDPWLARNPSTPPDILEVLSRGADVIVIQGLLQNPGLSCAMLPEVERSLRAERCR